MPAPRKQLATKAARKSAPATGNIAVYSDDDSSDEYTDESDEEEGDEGGASMRAGGKKRAADPDPVGEPSGQGPERPEKKATSKAPTSLEASAAVLESLGPDEDLDSSSPFFRASHATWKTTARIEKDYMDNSGTDEWWRLAQAALKEQRPRNPFRLLESLAREHADKLDSHVALQKQKRREVQLEALATVKRQRTLNTSGAGATARKLSALFGTGQLVSSLRTMPESERADVVKLMDPRLLLELQLAVHVQAGRGGGGGGEAGSKSGSESESGSGSGDGGERGSGSAGAPAGGEDGEGCVPADVAAVLTPALLDKAIKREDDYYRVLFAQDRHHADLKDPQVGTGRWSGRSLPDRSRLPSAANAS